MNGLLDLPRSLVRVTGKHLREWRPRRSALPTFLVIGAMKAGTSSLHRYLDSHPDVWMSRTKETDWFLRPGEGRRGDHDLAWYLRQFDGRVPARGETSPNYAKRHLFDGVPERARRLVPHARLVYVVRDPVDRAISHWLHGVRGGRFAPDRFERYMRPRPGHPIWDTSRYAHQLDAWLEHWDLDDVLVVAAEDLRDRRRPTLAAVFAFLGVDPGHDSEAFDRMVHVTPPGGPRDTPGDPTTSPTAVTPRPAGSRRPTLSPALHEQVAAFLQPDVDRLRALTGDPFPGWSP